ncbi:MAG: hypothetical protein KDK78_01270, partial [Chlamydiia bacterium]|nr:hypothetical protein [Chlamydiia bacterium]
SRYMTIEVELLVANWRKSFADLGGCKGHNYIVHHAHSAGSELTLQALTYLSDEEKLHLIVFSYGAEGMIPADACALAINYVHSGDLVPHAKEQRQSDYVIAAINKQPTPGYNIKVVDDGSRAPKGRRHLGRVYELWNHMSDCHPLKEGYLSGILDSQSELKAWMTQREII